MLTIFCRKGPLDCVFHFSKWDNLLKELNTLADNLDAVIQEENKRRTKHEIETVAKRRVASIKRG